VRGKQKTRAELRQSMIPKKWEPVFGKDHAQTKGSSGMPIQLNLIPLQDARSEQNALGLGRQNGSVRGRSLFMERAP
jgi:hypothetical protein